VSRISQFGRVAAAEGTTFSSKFFLKSRLTVESDGRVSGGATRAGVTHASFKIAVLADTAERRINSLEYN
jgi:hypothetical protein